MVGGIRNSLSFVIESLVIHGQAGILRRAGTSGPLYGRFKILLRGRNSTSYSLWHVKRLMYDTRRQRLQSDITVNQIISQFW